MPRAGCLILAILVVLILLVVPGGAEAQFYRWTDERGTPHYTQGRDNVPERYRPQAESLGYRNSPAPDPTEKTAAEGAARSEGATIRYTPGQPIIVDVRINGSSAQLVLDTGADRTLISPRALAAGGVSLTRPIAEGQITGVTGTDRVQYVIVDVLEVGSARVTRLPVMSYEISGLQGDGLLGRDFLDRFTINIDSSRGEVTLTPK
jgi:predicted aspartyl protease